MTDAIEGGTLARFDSPRSLVDAAVAARRAGFAAVAAYSPFPVPGLEEVLERRGRWIGPCALVAGLVAGGAMFLLQWYAAIWGYPYVAGGKPLASWPAFLPASFEFAMLAAVLAALVAMLVGNRLPHPHHAVFDWDAFEAASADGFFLLIGDGDPAARAALMQRHGARATREVEA